MEDGFLAIHGGRGNFSAANEDAAAAILVAGSADSAAMRSSAVAALGPIGANYLAAFGPAQAQQLGCYKARGSTRVMTGVQSTLGTRAEQVSATGAPVAVTGLPELGSLLGDAVAQITVGANLSGIRRAA